MQLFSSCIYSIHKSLYISSTLYLSKLTNLHPHLNFLLIWKFFSNQPCSIPTRDGIQNKRQFSVKCHTNMIPRWRSALFQTIEVLLQWWLRLLKYFVWIWSSLCQSAIWNINETFWHIYDVFCHHTMESNPNRPFTSLWCKMRSLWESKNDP